MSESRDEARRRAAEEVTRLKRDHQQRVGNPMSSRDLERFQSEIGRRNERKDSERRGR